MLTLSSFLKDMEQAKLVSAEERCSGDRSSEVFVLRGPLTYPNVSHEQREGNSGSREMLVEVQDKFGFESEQ